MGGNILGLVVEVGYLNPEMVKQIDSCNLLAVKEVLIPPALLVQLYLSNFLMI
jgi:hypothetical protein